MKTFRLIGMALVAVLMCVNFASCSDDDEEEVSKKSLAEMIIGRWEQFHSNGDYDDVIVVDKTTIKWWESYPDYLITYSSYTVDEASKTVTAYDAEDGHAHKFLIMSISDTEVTISFKGDGSDPETFKKAK